MPSGYNRANHHQHQLRAYIQPKYAVTLYTYIAQKIVEQNDLNLKKKKKGENYIRHSRAVSHYFYKIGRILSPLEQRPKTHKKKWNKIWKQFSKTHTNRKRVGINARANNA